MQLEAWMTAFLFKKIFYFFKRSILGGISLTNRHLFIFNGHGSHVTLEAIEQAQTFRLYMVTLHSHTSHALQPLDVAYFKPFNTTFKKEKNTTMINKNYIELDKIFLARWVDKTLHQTLS
jgi:5-keto 4-deoxyuronate isomerase